MHVKFPVNIFVSTKEKKIKLKSLLHCSAKFTVKVNILNLD